MSAHRFSPDWYKAAANKEYLIADPGDTGTIDTRELERGIAACDIVSAAAETRTVADPSGPMQHLLLRLKTDGGDVTLTFSSAYNEAGQTTATLDDANDYMYCVSIEDGSSTYAWRVLSSSGSGVETISFGDNEELIFGDGPDVSTYWDGTNLITAPRSGLWAGYPSPADPDPYRRPVEIWDDFTDDVDSTVWTALTDGCTGATSIVDTKFGILSTATAAADNDYHGYSSLAEVFDLATDGAALWFEARFKLTEANTNESAWWFGVSDTLTTGGFQANAAGPLASYDGALIWKDEATMAIDAETSNAGTQDTETNIATFVSNTWTRVGFFISSAATTAVMTAYYDVDGCGLNAHGTTMNLTRSGLQEMHAVFGVKAGPMGGAETLLVDYVKVGQLRV